VLVLDPSLPIGRWGVASFLWLIVSSQITSEALLVDIRITSQETHDAGLDFAWHIFLFST
jgi:hypothetical protein